MELEDGVHPVPDVDHLAAGQDGEAEGRQGRGKAVPGVGSGMEGGGEAHEREEGRGVPDGIGLAKERKRALPGEKRSGKEED